jgi:multiple sugar transport system substrate-binding protein
MKTNRMSRREFLKFMGIAAAGTSLAACTPKPTAAPVAATNVPVSAPAVKKDIKLVAFTKGGDVGDGLSACIDLVKKKTGILLEIQTGTEDSFVSRVAADFAAGGGSFDVLMMPYNMMREYAVLGHLASIDDKIKASPEINAKDFIPALLKEYGNWNGQQWALPGKADVYVAFHRKDILEDTKIQDLFKSRTGMNLKAPETVEESLILAEFFTKKINPDSPLEYGWSNWSEKLGIKWWWGPRMFALGGSYLDDKNHPNFNNEAGLQALKDCLAMHQFAPPDIVTFDWGPANQVFLNGSTFMIDQWNSFGGEVNTREGYFGLSEVVGKTGFGVLSGYQDGGSLVRKSNLGGWCVGISKYTKEVQAAFDALVVLTSKEAEILRLPLHYAPTRTSTYAEVPDSPQVEHYPATADNFAVANVPANIYAPPIGQPLETFMDITLSEALQGLHTPEKALEIIEKEWTKQLKDAGTYG